MFERMSQMLVQMMVQMMITLDSIRIPGTHARETGDVTLPKKRGLKRHYGTGWEGNPCTSSTRPVRDQLVNDLVGLSVFQDD